MNAEMYLELNPNFRKAVEYIRNTDFASLENGKHSIEGDKLYAVLMEYETVDANECKLEAHRKYIDLQYVISGYENIGVALLSDQQIFQDYNPDDDCALYNAGCSKLKISEGEFAIFFPNDLHMPCLKIIDPVHVRKVVVKIQFEQLYL